MSYPINYPTPQNANVQIFNTNTQNNVITPPFAGAATWIKPQGASFVWFTLIGPGSNGDGTNGGGSGAVTNFMCPAFLIPDELQVIVPNGNNNAVGNRVDTQIYYQQKNGDGYQLLMAMAGQGNSGGNAMTGNYFTAMGFFQSVAGQSGASGVASTTTFLCGGGFGSGVVNANYGYSTKADGYFQMQPIIVGVGGDNITQRGGIGCGGGTNAGQNIGGSGLAVIITW